MSNGKYLLDTNIVIGLFNGEQNIINLLKKLKNIFILSIVVGELFYGAFKSANQNQNIDKLKSFIDKVSIIYCDEETAYEYGKIKYQLKKMGRPVPENDLWIASIASQYNLTLITYDNHFKEIDINILKEF